MKPTIVAHRGESHDAPENTMAAFRLAWERGCAIFELDVHLTADGQLAVIHDGNTRRTTGIDLAVEQAGMADLAALDAGAWKDARWAGEPIPVLDTVLAAKPIGVTCLVELKGGPALVEPLRRSMEAARCAPSSIVVISFDDGSVAEARRVLPEVPAWLLSGFVRDAHSGGWLPTLDELVARARACNATGIGVAATGAVDATFIAGAHQEGLTVNVWTIDEVGPAQAMAEAGADTITTNRAAWMREQLGLA